MEEKQESIFKVTKERKKLFHELQRMVNKYPCKEKEEGISSPEVELWLAKLDNHDFHEMMMLPIGNYSRVHHTRIRNHGIEERLNVVLVYYGKESSEKVDSFFDFLKKEGFERKTTGPINSSSCPWVYVLFNKKQFIIGKPGIDFKSKRAITHSILIDEFMEAYNDYKNTGKISNDLIDSVNKKYKGLSIFCFNKKEEAEHKKSIQKAKVAETISKLKFKYYYNKYNSYEEYKEKVIICLMEFHNMSRGGALEEYKIYENKLKKDFDEDKEYNPSTAATYIAMGY